MTLPTYNDQQVGVGRRIMGRLLVPFFGFLAIGMILVITQTSSSYYRLSLVPFFGGIAWLVSYVYYLNKKFGK